MAECGNSYNTIMKKKKFLNIVQYEYNIEFKYSETDRYNTYNIIITLFWDFAFASRHYNIIRTYSDRNIFEYKYNIYKY